ncbi:MAG TPA: error-prone DNA polymerase [Thermoanaerobaculia bacterium]|nr:error-prone DNA polymerase [Thermoanaerobaculia bacterium]
MPDKRSRPSDNAPELPPARDLGAGNASCGGGTHEIDPFSRIVAPGARKERLRRRSWNPPASRLAPRPYAELRAASAFSFLDGASLPEDLIDRAAGLGLPAVALVDRNGVYGAPRFYKAAREADIKALVGAEVTLRGDSPLTLASPPRGRRGEEPPAPPPPRITLLVENRAGYRNLCRLITAGALGRAKGETAVTREQVAEHSGGLWCLTGGDESPAASALSSGGLEAARDCLERLAAAFPGRLLVELQRHRRREEERRNQALVDCARRLRLPLVATNGVRYASPRDKELHDVLTAIRCHTTLDGAGRLLAAERERHLKDAREMAELFADLPEALDGAFALSQRLDFTLADLGYRFPDFPLPPGETPASYLRQLAWNGARTRFRPLTARAQAQIEKELAMIEKLDLPGYFLIVWDVVRFCREQKILVQGRGSAANSAVCYALSITAVDPVKMELLFERFLSEERGEWPDIDLDLPSGDQREKVIQHVYEKYGPHGAGMTANVITYRDRSSAREAGKALGYSPEQVDRLSKHLSGWNFGEIREPIEELSREVAAAGLDPEDVRTRHFLRLFLQIQNLPRHLGQHSGGMVVAAGRLDEVVPLEPAAMPGRVVVQWDKDDCADLGIVKVDLLGLGMLAALEEAIPLIRTHEKTEVDLAHLPADDPAVYAMLNAADTVGCFQVESRAQMASLPRNAPEKFYDIVIQVAIIRPGPIVGGMVHPFFDRRRGRAPVEYPHPCLEPILKRTLGVPLFQEQLLRIAMVAAGFTGGEAEELRRAMGFKRSVERMASIETRLRAGMEARGIGAAARDQIVKSITSFALYGFPESHAASFALIAYASCYLKAHHPAAFLAALLNCWPMGFYHPATLVQDAQRHGVGVRPIDATRSGWKCRWEEGAVRLGLRFVLGLRETTGRRIEEEQAEAPFSGVEDLARRCALRPDELARLADAGTLAAFGRSRRAALWQVAKVARPAGPLLETLAVDDPSPLPEMTGEEETAADYRATQMTTGPHLMAHWRERLSARGVLSAGELAKLPDGQRVQTAGAVIVRQRPGTAKGFVFLTLEDESGLCQAIVRPNLFREQRAIIVGSGSLVVEGRLQKQDGTLSVRAERFWTLDQLESVPSHDFR